MKGGLEEVFSLAWEMGPSILGQLMAYFILHTDTPFGWDLSEEEMNNLIARCRQVSRQPYDYVNYYLNDRRPPEVWKDIL